jgi:adenylosuccinate synthase
MRLLRLQRKSKNSTLKGIGPTYMDKTGRNGIRVEISSWKTLKNVTEL